MKTKRREDDRLLKMLGKVPRHPSRMKWVLSEIKEKKVSLVMRDGQVCVLIRYTVGNRFVF